MDYFRDAFGGFDPQSDRDAALKLALDALVATRRIGELQNILDEESKVDGLAGEPGWALVRRKSSAINWPIGTDFHASVERKVYDLRYPDFYLTRDNLIVYIKKILRVYLERYPDECGNVQNLTNLISPS